MLREVGSMLREVGSMLWEVESMLWVVGSMLRKAGSVSGVPSAGYFDSRSKVFPARYITSLSLVVKWGWLIEVCRCRGQLTSRDFSHMSVAAVDGSSSYLLGLWL